ncbi:nucleoside diphosphate-linked moiety X motif 8 [Sergentomyia squamirostris]
MSAMRALQICNETLLSAANRQQTLEKLTKPLFPILSSDKKKRQAAVLIALCEEKDNSLSLLYTLRSSNLTRHTGQVSFPGGMRDPTDSAWADCALRETEEEVGINRKLIDIWGTAAPLVVPWSSVTIYPVIGSIRNFSKLQLKLNPDEVEEAFTVSLQHLCDPENQRHTQFKTGTGVIVPAFINTPAKIWGITGFLTHHFLRALLPKDAYRRSWPLVTGYKL